MTHIYLYKIIDNITMIHALNEFNKSYRTAFEKEISSYIIIASAGWVPSSHVLLSDIHFLQLTGSNEVIHHASKRERELASISQSQQTVSKSVYV